MNPNSIIPKGQPIFWTDFTGQGENPNVGPGVAVGLDLNRTKTVARLSPQAINEFGVHVLDLPKYIVSYRSPEFYEQSGANYDQVFAQDNSGYIYFSANAGLGWSRMTGNTITANSGRGLAIWRDYLVCFRPTTIDLYGPLSGTPSWTLSWKTGLIDQQDHYPLVFPDGGPCYFCNGSSVGIMDIGTSSAGNPQAIFDPATPGTYSYSDATLLFPPFYHPLVLGFNPPGNLAIGLVNDNEPSTADIAIYNGNLDNTIQNIVSLPGATGPATQMITRNGVLYVVTGNDQAIYIFNGSVAVLQNRLAYYMSSRATTGEQDQAIPMPYLYQSAIEFFGPELLTGCGNTNIPNTTAGYGLYPYGVWSLQTEQGFVSTRFPLSHGSINATWGTAYNIGALKCVTGHTSATGGNEVNIIVGWQQGGSFGLDTIFALGPNTSFISNAATVFCESPLWEVGDKISPETYSKLVFNLVNPLIGDQTLQFYVRASLSDPYESIGPLWTATLMNGDLSNYISPLDFQANRYVQLAFSMNTGTGDDAGSTPLLRTVELDP